MTPEELLKPRYKVIAPWPGTHWKVGDIFEYGDHNCFKTESQPSIPMHLSVLDEHPHLFKKLEWWEERKPDEMPEYVKHITTGKIWRVKEYDLPAGAHVSGNEISSYWAAMKNLQPATEADYNAYLKTLTS